MLSLLIVAGVFGLAFPRISSYGQQWHSIAALPGMLLVTTAATGSLATTWVTIAAFLPRLRFHQAAAVNLGSSAVANTVPAGGAVALGLTWRILASWGIPCWPVISCDALRGSAAGWPAVGHRSYLPSIPLGALAYLWWRHRVRSQRPCAPGWPPPCRLTATAMQEPAPVRFTDRPPVLPRN